MKKNISSVIWITGLSGSGKTTISKILKKKLSLLYKKVIHLDGDELRACASTIIKKDSFHRNGRKNIGLFYSKLAKHLAKQNFIVIMSVMALQREVQNWNKVNIPHFYDVMLMCQLRIKVKRPKGIYKKYSEGKIKNLYGLDLQYDKPKKPWMNVKWSKELNKKLIVELIMNKFIKEIDI